MATAAALVCAARALAAAAVAGVTAPQRHGRGWRIAVSAAAVSPLQQRQMALRRCSPHPRFWHSRCGAACEAAGRRGALERLVPETAKRFKQAAQFNQGCRLQSGACFTVECVRESNVGGRLMHMREVRGTFHAPAATGRHTRAHTHTHECGAPLARPRECQLQPRRCASSRRLYHYPVPRVVPLMGLLLRMLVC